MNDVLHIVTIFRVFGYARDLARAENYMQLHYFNIATKVNFHQCVRLDVENKIQRKHWDVGNAPQGDIPTGIRRV